MSVTRRSPLAAGTAAPSPGGRTARADAYAPGAASAAAGPWR
ncbi:hypothetical protein AB0469_33810 [Streptomyces sp. NPDC093801]